MFHKPAVQRKFLWEIVAVIKKEVNKGKVEGLRIHAEVHRMNENEASEEEILSWVRSVRIFKKRDKKRKNPDIRNVLRTRGKNML